MPPTSAVPSGSSSEKPYGLSWPSSLSRKLDKLKSRFVFYQLTWILIVLAAVFTTYSNSFENAFEFDDLHTIVDNPAIRSLHNIPRFFTDATTFSVQPANRTYRPVISTSLALDYAVAGGYNPFWFHLSTFFFFLGLLALLCPLYELLLKKAQPTPMNRWIALTCAAWFGLHPAIAETVNYIIQRGDLYCTLGCVAALLFFAQFPHLRRTGLYLVPIAFALLSKPPASVFPALLFFYVFFFEVADGRDRFKVSFLAALPSLVFTVGILWFESAMTPKSYLPSILRPWDYRLTQPFVWLRYFGELFLPIHLNVDTDLLPFARVNAAMLAGFAFTALLCAAIWISAQRHRFYPISYGLLWFLITQIPTSIYPLSETENDHRMFFSFVGLMLAVVWGGWLAIERPISRVRRSPRMRYSLICGLVLVLGGYAWGAHTRNAVWRNEESLWRDDVEKSPHNGRGRMIYGLALMRKGDEAAALDQFEQALIYTPNYSTLEINLGVVNGALADRGDPARSAEAERHFLRAISLAPSDDLPHAFYAQWLDAHGRSREAIDQLKTAIALNPQRPMPRELLVAAYRHAGEIEAAQRAAHESLAVAPGDSAIRNEQYAQPTQDAAFWINRSLAEYREAQFSESIESALRALQIDPRRAVAYNNIGAAYGAMREWDEAIHFEREALRRDPHLTIAQNNLDQFLHHKSPPPTNWSSDALIDESLALYRSGNFRQSIAVAQTALVVNPSSAEAWNNVAAAHAALHEWDQAIAAAQKAIAFKPDFQLAKNNLAWARGEKSRAGR